MTSLDRPAGDGPSEPTSHAADPDELTRQRLAELAARRSRSTRAAGSSAPGGTPGVTVPVDPAHRQPTRRHPALAARILTAGLSSALMLGIVADLGAKATPDGTVDVSSAAPVVTITSPTTSGPAVVVTELSGQPILLTAAPALRPVEPAPAQPPAPVVRTHGSR